MEKGSIDVMFRELCVELGRGLNIIDGGIRYQIRKRRGDLTRTKSEKKFQFSFEPPSMSSQLEF